MLAPQYTQHSACKPLKERKTTVTHVTAFFLSTFSCSIGLIGQKSSCLRRKQKNAFLPKLIASRGLPKFQEQTSKHSESIRETSNTWSPTELSRVFHDTSKNVKLQR